MSCPSPRENGSYHTGYLLPCQEIVEQVQKVYQNKQMRSPKDTKERWLYEYAIKCLSTSGTVKFSSNRSHTSKIHTQIALLGRHHYVSGCRDFCWPLQPLTAQQHLLQMIKTRLHLLFSKPFCFITSLECEKIVKKWPSRNADTKIIVSVLSFTQAAWRVDRGLILILHRYM